jgi:hypothetical protein
MKDSSGGRDSGNNGLCSVSENLLSFYIVELTIVVIALSFIMIAQSKHEINWEGYGK